MHVHIQELNALFKWAKLDDVLDDVHEFEQCLIIENKRIAILRLFHSYDIDLAGLTNRQKAALRKRLLYLRNIDKVCVSTLVVSLN